MLEIDRIIDNLQELKKAWKEMGKGAGEAGERYIPMISRNGRLFTDGIECPHVPCCEVWNLSKEDALDYAMVLPLCCECKAKWLMQEVA